MLVVNDSNITSGKSHWYSISAWAGPPTAEHPRYRRWRRQRSIAAERSPAWARCQAATSPEFSCLKSNCICIFLQIIFNGYSDMVKRQIWTFTHLVFCWLLLGASTLAQFVLQRGSTSRHPGNILGNWKKEVVYGIHTAQILKIKKEKSRNYKSELRL